MIALEVVSEICCLAATNTQLVQNWCNLVPSLRVTTHCTVRWLVPVCTTHAPLSACCIQRGVQSACMSACTFDVDITILSNLPNPLLCVGDLTHLISCAAGKTPNTRHESDVQRKTRKQSRDNSDGEFPRKCGSYAID